jgi:hypothetical protein
MGGGGRDYLEGDERVFLDGGDEPLLHGTGVEDFFGGGFYFRGNGSKPEVFRRALHGMTYDREAPAGEWTTGMYRLMLTDAPTWTESARVVLESGPLNQTPMRARTVAYLYVDAGAASGDAQHDQTGGSEQGQDDSGGQAHRP